MINLIDWFLFGDVDGGDKLRFGPPLRLGGLVFAVVLSWRLAEIVGQLVVTGLNLLLN